MPDINTKRKTTMLSDYIPQLAKLYPDVSEKDLFRIIRSFQFSFLNLVKKDVSIMIKQDTSEKQDKFMMIINNISTFNALKAYEKWRNQMIKKIRIKYKMLNRTWDGYYYFALSDRQLARVLSQKKKHSKNKIFYIFENVFLYKIFEECLTNESGKKHIFRVPYITDFGWKAYKPIYKCLDFEYIYRNHKDGLEPINVNSRCDNKLFNRNKDFLWLRWVDENYIKTKKKT